MKRNYCNWYMNTIHKILSLCLLFLLTIGMVSCNEEQTNEDDFKLKGDISKYVPAYAFDLDATILNGSDGYAYMKFSPITRTDLSLWGLQLRSAKYYVDGILVGTGNSSEQTLVAKRSLFDAGKHNVKAQFTIGGEECNEVNIDQEDDIFVISPNLDGYFDIDYNYVTKGDIFHVELYPPIGNDIHINKVTYTWDGTNYESVTSPYDWKHQVTEDIGTDHNLTVTISCTEGSSQITYTMSYSGIKIRDEEDEIVSTDLLNGITEYKNGQTIQLTSKSYIGRAKKDSYEIKYYLDDKLVGQTSSFPYTFKYKLSNESVGIHRLKSLAILKEEDGTEKSSSETNFDFLITK